MQNRKHRAFQELQLHVWSFGYLTGANRTERLQGLLRDRNLPDVDWNLA